jgi:hypothetical protein
MKPNPYDARALNEIHAWKNPEPGALGKAIRVINLPLEKAGDLLLSTPGLGDAIKRSAQGLTGVCNNVAQWSVKKEAVYARFRKAGHDGVKGQAGIFDIELEDIDRLVQWLGAKYKGIALAEGAGAGAMGLPGIPPDLVALVTLNLRAIGEYATYCGFDMDSREERLFAMHVLGLASSPNDAAKGLAMTELATLARVVAKGRARAHLEKQSFMQAIQGVAKVLGVRLTKAKLAQFAPAAGAAVGGGFNAYFTSKVCTASYFLYRERFLVRKYGVEAIRAAARNEIDS